MLKAKLSNETPKSILLKFCSMFLLCRADKSCMQMILLRAKECFIINKHDPSLYDQNVKHMALDVIDCDCDQSNALLLKSRGSVPWHNFILKHNMIINCIHWHSRNIPQINISLIWQGLFFKRSCLKFKSDIGKIQLLWNILSLTCFPCGPSGLC